MSWSPRAPLPGPGWTVEPVWALEDFVKVEGVLGSGEGPYAVAVDRPARVAVDAQGNFYATDTPRDRVYKFSPAGQVTATWGNCPDGGKGLGDLFIPGSLSLDQGGFLYMT